MSEPTKMLIVFGSWLGIIYLVFLYFQPPSPKPIDHFNLKTEITQNRVKSVVISNVDMTVVLVNDEKFYIPFNDAKDLLPELNNQGVPVSLEEQPQLSFIRKWSPTKVIPWITLVFLFIYVVVQWLRTGRF